MFPFLTILLAIPAAGSTKMQLTTVFRVIIIFLVWHTQQKKFCNRQVNLQLEFLSWLISSKITVNFSDLCQTLVWKQANIVENTTKLPEPSLLKEIRVSLFLYRTGQEFFVEITVLQKIQFWQQGPCYTDWVNSFVRLNRKFKCWIILKLIHVCLMLWQHLIDVIW